MIRTVTAVPTILLPGMRGIMPPSMKPASRWWPTVPVSRSSSAARWSARICSGIGLTT
ncbi:hypothetical protein ACFSTI_24845 [Rhizorhabdus histidinilytica]